MIQSKTTSDPMHVILMDWEAKCKGQQEHIYRHIHSTSVKTSLYKLLILVNSWLLSVTGDNLSFYMFQIKNGISW